MSAASRLHAHSGLTHTILLDDVEIPTTIDNLPANFSPRPARPNPPRTNGYYDFTASAVSPWQNGQHRSAIPAVFESSTSAGRERDAGLLTGAGR